MHHAILCTATVLARIRPCSIMMGIEADGYDHHGQYEAI